MKKRIIGLVLLALAAGGCASETGNGALAGGALGGLGGLAVGSAVGHPVGGALIGGGLGAIGGGAVGNALEHQNCGRYGCN